MGKIIVLILIGCFLGILMGVPLWLSVNLFSLIFHLPYHLTLLQAAAITILLNVVRQIIFGNNK